MPAAPPIQPARLQLTGPTAQRVRVQRSYNLRDCEDWQTMTLDGSTLEMTDERVEALQCFYRSVEDDSTPTP